jgi:hypothetical protein
MTESDLDGLIARAEAELGKLPGVAAVSWGHKEVDGRTTERLGLRVYVHEKQPLVALAPAALVPATFEGAATDVLRVIETVPLHCEDLLVHDPLIGGITISNYYDEPGTLGFFATINGEDGWDNVVLVSCNHVLCAFSAKKGDRVYQPRLVQNSDGSIRPVDMADKNPIGVVHKSGLDGVHPFTYPNEAERDLYIDCATARLDICVSSWCHTNCGVSYKNEIRGLNINKSDRLSDIGRITAADIGTPKAIVYKVGRKTGRSMGRVIDAFGPRGGPGKVIVIDPVGTNCEGNPLFGAKGDSGSAIVNEQRQLVGILCAQSGLNPTQTVAAHIHPVIDYLDITPITEAHPPKAPAGQARADTAGLFASGVNETGRLRERLLATPRGTALYERAFAHRLEVTRLVNTCRPVTVAWHRGQGPAFLNRAINNLRTPDVALPRSIAGVGRADLLRRMREELHRHGSDALRAALDAHGGELIALADSFGDLRELAGLLEREAEKEMADGSV